MNVGNTVEKMFRTGRVANPVKVIKREPYIVLDAQMSGGDAPFVRIFAKILPDRVRAIEAVCAWIGMQLNLPLPPAVFARLTRTIALNRFEWASAQSERTVFGTVAIPNALPARFNEGRFAERIASWPDLERAAAFDHLICNDDRTENNVLVDARGKFWLIDHGRAFGGGGERLFSTEFFPSARNYWLEQISRMNVEQRARRSANLRRAGMDLVALVPRVPYEILQVEQPLASEMDRFLRERASTIVPVLLNAIGISDLDLGSTNQQRIQ